MNAAAPYTIPPEEGRWPSLLLAAVVHMALLAFLWIGIRWQSETPVAVEAEVWDMQVQEAAPVAPPQPVVEPEPEPPKPVVKEPEPEVEKPDIALEQLKKKQEAERIEKERLEQERLEKLAEKKRLEAEKKAKALAEQKAIEKIRAEDMKRMMAGSGSPSSTGAVPKSTGPRGDPSYAAEVVRKIKSNITYGGETNVPGDPHAEYRITQLPSGEIISVKRIRSSGIPAYDAAVEKAIAKSSPLPRKKDGTVEREIVATFILKETP